MSTHVIGFVSEESKDYKKHSAVLRACNEADIEELPKESAEFFGSKYPELSLLEEILERELPVKEWYQNSSNGFELKVSEIPSEVDIIRFYNSY